MPVIDKYDNLIQEAAEKYLPEYDWRLLKAQLHCESEMECGALSKAGARGIAQFMPATWEEICSLMGYPKGDAEPENPHYAIPAAAYYMASILKKWNTNRPMMDRYALALASYNAGFGSIIKAQKVAHGVSRYSAIVGHLPSVTGKNNAKETTYYVKRILYVFNDLIMGA